MSPPSKKTIICFAEGTLISTEDGEIPIEEIKEGDSVLAYDFNSESVVTKKVTRLESNYLELNILTTLHMSQLKLSNEIRLKLLHVLSLTMCV